MARRAVVALAAAAALVAGCGDGGRVGPPDDPPDSVGTGGVASRIADAVEEATGVAPEVDCPDPAPVDEDGTVFVFCDVTAPDGSAVSVSVHSLSRAEHLDFVLALAPIAAVEERLARELGSAVDCPDLVEREPGAVVECSGESSSVEVTLGRLDDDYTYAVVAAG